MAKKTKYKLPMSASHLTLYVILSVYIVTAIVGIIIAWLLMNSDTEYTTRILIGLFSFVGVCGSVTVGFYSHKAQAENELSAKERTITKRLDLVKQIFDLKAKGKIDDNSVALALALLTDSDTTITTNGFGGITNIENTDFLVSNPNENFDFENEGR